LLFHKCEMSREVSNVYPSNKCQVRNILLNGSRIGREVGL
jgi:hypothetical protein